MKLLKEEGFSLLEMLVAFLILSIFLGVCLTVFSSSLQNMDSSYKRRLALSVLETRMAEIPLVITPSFQPRSGETEEGVSWNVEVDPKADEEGIAQITLRASWIDGGRSREVQIKTHRMVR